MVTRFLLTVLGLLTAIWARCATCDIVPVRLTCEMMEDPNCIDIRHPRLSWINSPADSTIMGAAQSAYRIRVASSPEMLDEPDIWDSRKTRSDRSVFIPYKGKELCSGQQVWWQVQVWDKHGNASEWSRPAKWRMGIVSPEEWQAKWIGAPWQGEWEDNNSTPVYHFRIRACVERNNIKDPSVLAKESRFK